MGLTRTLLIRAESVSIFTIGRKWSCSRGRELLRHGTAGPGKRPVHATRQGAAAGITLPKPRQALVLSRLAGRAGKPPKGPYTVRNAVLAMPWRALSYLSSDVFFGNFWLLLLYTNIYAGCGAVGGVLFAAAGVASDPAPATVWWRIACSTGKTGPTCPPEVPGDRRGGRGKGRMGWRTTSPSPTSPPVAREIGLEARTLPLRGAQSGARGPVATFPRQGAVLMRQVGAHQPFQPKFLPGPNPPSSSMDCAASVVCEEFIISERFCWVGFASIREAIPQALGGVGRCGGARRIILSRYFNVLIRLGVKFRSAKRCYSRRWSGARRKVLIG